MTKPSEFVRQLGMTLFNLFQNLDAVNSERFLANVNSKLNVLHRF